MRLVRAESEPSFSVRAGIEIQDGNCSLYTVWAARADRATWDRSRVGEEPGCSPKRYCVCSSWLEATHGVHHVVGWNVVT